MRSKAKLRDLRSVTQLPSRPKPIDVVGPVRMPEPMAPRRQRAPFRWSRLLDSLPMRSGRRLVGRLLGRVVSLAVYGTLAMLIGLTSAWYMIETGTRLTLERDGPWQRWTLAGAPDADPYTRAHFARAGWLPLNGPAAAYFTASRDSAGEPLYSDCDYSVSGSNPAARRWTLVAYDMSGMLLDVGAGPAAITSETALPGPGGNVTIAVTQSTSPGNWLNLTGATRMQLLLTLYGARQGTTLKAAEVPARHLFRIERIGCR